jgi:hypothetical protein
MILTIERFIMLRERSLSEAFVDGAHQCYICEDQVRALGAPKVPGFTAIPNGQYGLVIDRSPLFSARSGCDVFTPAILGVPGFSGVRIHPGNTEKDTEGCLLPGEDFDLQGVRRSIPAYFALLAKLRAVLNIHEPVTVNVRIRGT